jgi:TonB family protein
MTIALLVPRDIFGPASNRLLVGLAVSVSVHLVVMLSVRPVTYAYVPPQPLHVDIRDVTPAADAPSATAAESDHSAPAAGAPTAADTGRPDPREETSNPHGGPDFGLATDRYYASSEVDVRAEPIGETSLVYPQLAYQQRLPGKVTVSILINQRGGVDDVAVIKAAPPRVFEEAALNAARALKFSPALRGGRAVKSKKLVEVNFDPYERIATP